MYSKILLITLSFLFFTSCNYENKFDKERAAFVGNWNVQYDYKRFSTNGDLESDNSYEKTMTLNADGTGIEDNILPNNNSSFEWYYSVDPLQIILIQPFLSTFTRNITYDIDQVDESMMTWNTEYSTINGGDTVNIEIVRFLTKLE